MRKTQKNVLKKDKTEVSQVNNNSEKKPTIYEKSDKWLDIQLKALHLQEKKEQLRIEKIRHNHYSRQQALEALQAISYSVNGAFIIDSERTILASEPFIKNLYELQELKVIKKKTLELIAML